MSYHYVGSELTLFAAATNWKAYVGQVLGRYIAGRKPCVSAGPITGRNMEMATVASRATSTDVSNSRFRPRGPHTAKIAKDQYRVCPPQSHAAV
jgi:hypothetical protein